MLFFLRKIGLVCLLVVAQVASAFSAQVWYEDNNLGRGGGMPPDFVEKFRRPETFAQATKHMDVYLLRANVLQKMDDQFFTELLFPYLQKNGIKLAINAGGATWLGASEKREQFFEADLQLLAKIKRLGGKVDFISLQSILSKPRRQSGRDSEIVPFSLGDRIVGAVKYVRAVQDIFPDAAVGIIDALPAKGLKFREPYRELASAFKRAGLKLSYVHLDMSFEAPRTRRFGITWDTVRDVERFVEDELNLQFGIFIKSRKAGETSSAALRNAVISMLECYVGAGGTPHDFIVASWFKHPEKTIPENATGEDYPAMRILLDFGRRLEAIETAGQTWPETQQRDSAWLRQCGLDARK